MGKYIAKRLLHLAGILVAISFLTFLLMYLAPGDAAVKKLNAQGIAVSQEVLDKTRADMGLDRPFLVQYGDWAWKALRGDLGSSYKDGTSVAGKLGKAMGHTALLALGSLALSLLVSLPLAMLTAVKRDSVPDYVLRFFSFVANSLPISLSPCCSCTFSASRPGCCPWWRTRTSRACSSRPWPCPSP